jgi:hypothetical protein
MNQEIRKICSLILLNAYFALVGAKELTIFSNRGSPRSGLQSGCNFKRA